MKAMRKILLLGLASALALTATAWVAISYRPASLASPAEAAAIDIAAMHRSVDTAALPVAPVADYHEERPQ
jgi:hypothetical protein